jgi:hypothetical protein
MPVCLKLKLLLPVLATFAVLLVMSTTALGQCSMCRAALGGSNNAIFIRNFNIGVLVLLLPPVTIFCSIFVALRRYKSADDKQAADEESRCANNEPRQ